MFLNLEFNVYGFSKSALMFSFFHLGFLLLIVQIHCLIKKYEMVIPLILMSQVEVENNHFLEETEFF
jgi:hypothetical protein